MSGRPRTTALITDASSGVGAVYAERLARRRYDLILVKRDAARLTATAEATTRLGVAVETMRAELAVPAELRCVEARLRNDNAIWLLVNNAGISAAPGMIDADPEALERVIAVIVTAPTRLAAAAATSFAAVGEGAIINVSSALALTPELFSGAYSGSKAFVSNLSLSLARELAGRGVRVQTVLPGATVTAFWSGAESAMPAGPVMAADEMVDAALSGFDAGEEVTIPSLPEQADWDAYDAARTRLAVHLTRQHSADRYRRAA